MFTFSVMGDSISSFEGTSPENYAVFAVLLGVNPNMVPVAVVLRHWGAVDKRRIQVFRF